MLEHALKHAGLNLPVTHAVSRKNQLSNPSHPRTRVSYSPAFPHTVVERHDAKSIFHSPQNEHASQRSKMIIWHRRSKVITIYKNGRGNSGLLPLRYLSIDEPSPVFLLFKVPIYPHRRLVPGPSLLLLAPLSFSSHLCRCTRVRPLN